MIHGRKAILALLATGGLAGCATTGPGDILARHEAGGTIEIAGRDATLQRIRADCNGDFRIVAEREQTRLVDHEGPRGLAFLAAATQAANGTIEEDGSERYERIRVWDYVCAAPRSVLTGRTRPRPAPMPDETARLEVAPGVRLQRNPIRLQLDWDQAKRYCDRLEPAGSWRIPAVTELASVAEDDALWAMGAAGEPLHLAGSETRPAPPRTRAAVRCATDS